MGVIVTTRDGADTFSDAEDFYGEEGRLVIGNDEAIFAPGYWLSARVGDLASAAEPAPRVWEYLSGVPHGGPAVIDAHGREWISRESEWGYVAGGVWGGIGWMKSHSQNHRGPFTEVL